MTTSTSARKSLQTTLEVPVLRRKYYAQTQADSTANRKVAWCSNNIPGEILDAAGVTAVFLENYATVIASKRLGSAFCAAGEKAGFSQDVCGYARMLMGYVLAKNEAPEAPYGGLAKPDFLLVNAYSCDSRMGWFAAMSRALNLPLHVHDGLYQPDGGNDSPAAVAYAEREIRSLISFLEKQTGNAFNPRSCASGRNSPARPATSCTISTSFARRCHAPWVRPTCSRPFGQPCTWQAPRNARSSTRGCLRRFKTASPKASASCRRRNSDSCGAACPSGTI